MTKRFGLTLMRRLRAKMRKNFFSLRPLSSYARSYALNMSPLLKLKQVDRRMARTQGSGNVAFNRGHFRHLVLVHPLIRLP